MANAKVLFLHHSPNKAAVESRLISGENKDHTAPCVMQLLREHHIDVCDTIGWNLVPWALPDPTKPDAYRVPKKQNGYEGLPYLNDLLLRLGNRNLKVVFLLGKFVQGFKNDIVLPPHVRFIECMMPTQQALNRYGWEEVRQKFQEVADAIK